MVVFPLWGKFLIFLIDCARRAAKLLIKCSERNAIKLSDVDSDTLAAYRKDWIDYIEAHKYEKLTRDAVLEEAENL